MHHKHFIVDGALVMAGSYSRGPRDHDGDLTLDAAMGRAATVMEAVRRMEAETAPISDVRGRIRFDALNGGVHLRGTGGDVEGHTTNGGLNVDLDGDRWNRLGPRRQDHQRRRHHPCTARLLGAVGDRHCERWHQPRLSGDGPGPHRSLTRH